MKNQRSTCYLSANIPQDKPGFVLSELQNFYFKTKANWYISSHKILYQMGLGYYQIQLRIVSKFCFSYLSEFRRIN